MYTKEKDWICCQINGTLYYIHCLYDDFYYRNVHKFIKVKKHNVKHFFNFKGIKLPSNYFAKEDILEINKDFDFTLCQKL